VSRAVLALLPALLLVAGTAPAAGADPRHSATGAAPRRAPGPADAGAAPSAVPIAEETRTAEERFAAANAAFAAGRYEEAIAGFQDLVAREGYSAALLFDLGNAFFRAGRLAEAILSYERALFLEPGDPDVQANLRQARRAANLPLPPEDGWLRFARGASSDSLALLASAALFLAAIVASALGLGRAALGDRGGLRRALASTAATALVVAVGAAVLCWNRLEEAERAVVIGADAALLVAPYREATVSSALAPGEIVRIEQQHHDFALARTSSGRSGWVRRAAIEPILPR
jgi:tetratricopeptide (TPR) repeat protein